MNENYAEALEELRQKDTNMTRLKEQLQNSLDEIESLRTRFVKPNVLL